MMQAAKLVGETAVDLGDKGKASAGERAVVAETANAKAQKVDKVGAVVGTARLAPFHSLAGS